MKHIILVFLLAGCTLELPTAPLVDVPAKPEEPKPAKAEPTPDEVFTKEFDACWAAWKECLKIKPDSECFPVHEACAIKAYRKLKKARGE